MPFDEPLSITYAPTIHHTPAMCQSITIAWDCGCKNEPKFTYCGDLFCQSIDKTTKARPLRCPKCSRPLMQRILQAQQSYRKGRRARQRL